MQKTQKAFTLVELIVVITILAILGTISFISLQGYSKKARDSRRIADISNIKTSLELFSLNTGYYPLPDNGEEVLYDNDLLWTQGVVGTNVTTNLSRNLQEKPTDPLHDIEYIYSLTSSKKEYEVMSVYEGDLANNSLINSTYALDKYRVKVEGNYNELFVKTSRHIVPVPSIINSAPLPLDFDLVPLAIESQVITGGDNFPGLNIPNTETNTGALKMTLSVYTGSINKESIDDDKKAVVEKIQLAYSGSDIETTGVYKTLLEQTTDEELLSFIDDVVLSNSSSSVVKNTDSPTGGNFSMDSITNSVNVTLTITCPEGGGVEMYISGDITETPTWEACNISKTVTLITGDGIKNITMNFRDSQGNEGSNISDNIELEINKEQLFTVGGSYNWVVPSNVNSISYVAVGAGGSGCGDYTKGIGGGGGALIYENNLTVTPGQVISITVGVEAKQQNGGSSYINIGSGVANGGKSCSNGGAGGVRGIGTGGNGGNGGNPGTSSSTYEGGGGGAGGYSGNGGNGGAYSSGTSPSSVACSSIGSTPGAGGGGGGGAFGGGYSGGGVGLYGQGINGLPGCYNNPDGINYVWGAGGGSGGSSSGQYGGGAGGGMGAGSSSGAGGGAVRIIRPGDTKLFPSTNVN